MRTLFGLVIVLGVSVAAASAQEGRKPNPAADASNAFAVDLYKKLDAQNAGKNLFYSPFSISVALAMTMEGARGETAREMGQVLRLPESLRQKSAEEPWSTLPYAFGFQEITRRIGRTKGPQAEADARKLAELRAQLAEINQRLVIPKDTPDDDVRVAAITKEINDILKTLPGYELKVANALFGEKTYPFKKSYLDTVDNHFGAGGIRSADFRNNYPGERQTINRWVEEQTNNRIKDLLPALSKEEGEVVRLVLVNAIFFKGDWAVCFPESQTKPEPFHAAAGKVDVPMMHQANGSARYAAFNGDGSFFKTPTESPFSPRDPKFESNYPAKDGFLVAEMPFQGDKLSMVLIAPRSIDGLPALEAKLTGDALSRWLARLEPRTVQFAVPRFKIESSYGLGKTLADMGMPRAFDLERVDFSAMSDSTNPDDKLFISHVLHKAFVEVNEKGAEAAAATAVVQAIVPVALETIHPFIPEFRADRPYLFLIRDRESGMILFLGRMTTPPRT